MHALVQWVSSFVGNTSASRGLEYYQMGSVIIESESSHQGSKPEELAHVVRGIIQGTSPTPYQAWVSFTDSAISDGHCSCPVGGNGKCKHVAALLLAAKAGPVMNGAKTQLAPGASASTPQTSPQKSLYSGPFSATLASPTTPTSGFRAHFSPKKSPWNAGLTAVPTQNPPLHLNFGNSSQPTPTSNHARNSPEQQPLSQPARPVGIIPRQLFATATSAPEFSMQAMPALVPPQLTQADSEIESPEPTLEPKTQMIEDSVSMAVDSEAFTEHPESEDDKLKESLDASKHYTSLLEKKADVLQEQVSFLQAELQRKNQEMERMRVHHDLQIKSLTQALTAAKQYKQAHQEEASQAKSTVAVVPVAASNQVAKPEAPLKDSIEDDMEEELPTSPYKKRGRGFEAEMKAGPSKLRSPLDLHSNPAVHFLPAASTTPVTNPLVCSVDSQALLEALYSFEQQRGLVQSANPVEAPPSPTLSQYGIDPTPPVPPELLNIGRTPNPSPSTDDDITANNSIVNNSSTSKPPSPITSLRGPVEIVSPIRREESNPMVTVRP